MKEKETNIFKLLYFIYKKFYVETNYKWQIWSLFILTFLRNIYPLVYSYILGLIIDAVTTGYNSGATFESLHSIIIVAVIFSLSWVIISNLFKYMDTIINLWRPYLEDEVYLKKYIKIEPKAYENPGFANKKSSLNWNSWMITNALSDIIQILAAIPAIIISFWSIYLVVPIFPFLGLLAVIPTALIIKKFGKKIWNIWSDNGEEKIKYSSYRSILWGTNFESLQEVYIFKYGKFLIDKATAINKKFTTKLQKNHKQRYTWTLFTDFLSAAMTIFVLIYSIKLVFDGQLSIGMLTFVLSAYRQFTGDMELALYRSSILLGNKKLLSTFHSVLNWENTIVNGETKLKETDSGLSIEFKNVWFKYDRSKVWVVKDLSFSVNKDDDIALVGKNGAGKTTLIKLLLRIYDPQKGKILINGIDIKELDLDDYYKMVGILSQSFNKLHITASDNIRIGDVRNRKKDDIVFAAKKADIHTYISSLPKKYDTFMSREIKDGMQLSGGQWQKLAIARAFFRDAKLLILDEPTSSVDSISEEKIFENLRKNADHMTTFIVSHRFATVRKAARILVVDNGKIVEDGNHKELMSKAGLYSQMYNKQVGAKS